MIKFKPIGNFVSVKIEKEEEKTLGGIYLPDQAKNRPERGTIIGVGQGQRAFDGSRIPMDLKVGDNIIFARYAPITIKIGGEDIAILPEGEVYGVIEDVETPSDVEENNESQSEG